jgi:copper(I)-binding protein
MRFFAIALSAALIGGIPVAGRAAAATIEVEHAWARATTSVAETGAVYVTITNHGTEPDQLIGASSPIAAKAELHQTVEDNGVMKMTPLTDIPVAASTSVTLQPGHLHIMLVGLVKPLKLGDSFPLTLTLKYAGSIQTTVTVVKPGATDGAMPNMKM